MELKTATTVNAYVWKNQSYSIDPLLRQGHVISKTVPMTLALALVLSRSV